MQIRFGTDGWRGVIARDYTFENVSTVAQAVMDYFILERLAEKGLVVGFDRRFMSRQFAERVAEVAAGNGIDVVLTDGYAPTPAVSWAVHEREAGGGIMITASHNPPEYNGLKIKELFGGPARPATTRAVEEIIERNAANRRPVAELSFSEAVRRGMVRRVDVKQPYYDQLARYVDLDLIRNAGLSIAVDPMYGAGSGCFTELLPGITEIHDSENPCFGGHPPEPTDEHLEELRTMVGCRKYHVGLALDGDADRIGAVDETGEYFSSHRIFTVVLRHLYERKGLRGAVARTVSGTAMIDLLCRKYGLELYETPVGFKHICELMLDHDILMGGEESGGLGVKGHIPERDGILMGLLLMEAMAMTGKGIRCLLNETMDEIGYFYYRRIDLQIEDPVKKRLIARLQEESVPTIAGRKVTRENFRDGFKFFFADGSWLLIRPSGTEPLLRLYCEANDPAVVEELLRAGREIAGI